jgi:hypothetical protein
MLPFMIPYSHDTPRSSEPALQLATSCDSEESGSDDSAPASTPQFIELPITPHALPHMYPGYMPTPPFYSTPYSLASPSTSPSPSPRARLFQGSDLDPIHTQNIYIRGLSPLTNDASFTTLCQQYVSLFFHLILEWVHWSLVKP